MSEDHKLPAKTSLGGVVPREGSAIVESSEVAGFAIGRFLGAEIKRPIAGLALLIMDAAEKLPPQPLQITQAQTVLPPGSLVIAPDSNHLEGMKAAMWTGMQHIRGKVGGFLERKGHLTQEESDPQIERIMREAIAEAAEWRMSPEKLTSKVQMERAVGSARHQFKDIIDAGLLADGQGGAAVTGQKKTGRIAG